MRDEATGSWWQQVSGEAIQGSLKGRQLLPVFCDELTFATWKREQPAGRVLLPDTQVAGMYAPPDWEQKIGRYPVVTPTDLTDVLNPRTLVVGINLKSIAKAYPLELLQKQKLILDQIGSVPLFLIVGTDQKSVRAFDRRVDGRKLEFFVVNVTDTSHKEGIKLVDAETGSEWNYQGRAINGSMSGKQLEPIPILKDYWFDWKNYHPKTAIYLHGERLKNQNAGDSERP